MGTDKMGYPKNITNNTLTVQELIDLLEDVEDKDLPVMFVYNYGDHWKTNVAAYLEGAEIGEVSYSDYHNMYKVEEEPTDKDEVYKVYLLNNPNF